MLANAFADESRTSSKSPQLDCVVPLPVFVKRGNNAHSRLACPLACFFVVLADPSHAHANTQQRAAAAGGKAGAGDWRTSFPPDKPHAPTVTTVTDATVTLQWTARGPRLWFGVATGHQLQVWCSRGKRYARFQRFTLRASVPSLNEGGRNFGVIIC